MNYRDKEYDKLINLKKKKNEKKKIVNGNGEKVDKSGESLNLGKRGKMMIKDIKFMDEIEKFERESIKERVVNEKGEGEFG